MLQHVTALRTCSCIENVLSALGVFLNEVILLRLGDKTVNKLTTKVF